MDKLKLILATNNAHKVEEICHFIGNDFELLTLEQIGFEGDIDKTGTTLAENSQLKAEYIYEKYQQNCLADDSGLEVPSLNYEPGVYSARYAGPQRIHDENMNLLLQKLDGKTDRSARFRTVITLIFESKINQFEGIVNGKIITQKIGNQGFGYDPIFVPDGHENTFAEMTLDQKNGLSHRTKAIKKMVDFLAKKNQFSI
jgi:XTP/dITP diphosphohydrolase